MEAIRNIELNKIVRIILLAVAGTLLLTISAKVKIPFYPVPMPMQTVRYRGGSFDRPANGRPVGP